MKFIDRLIFILSAKKIKKLYPPLSTRIKSPSYENGAKLIVNHSLIKEDCQ